MAKNENEKGEEKKSLSFVEQLVGGRAAIGGRSERWSPAAYWNLPQKDL